MATTIFGAKDGALDGARLLGRPGNDVIDANVNRSGNQSFTFGTQTEVGRLCVEDNPDSASSLVMVNNGGPQMLVIAVQDWASRDVTDWIRATSCCRKHTCMR